MIWEPTGYGARRDADGYTVTTWVAPQARQFPTEVIETGSHGGSRTTGFARTPAGPAAGAAASGSTRVYEVLAERSS